MLDVPVRLVPARPSGFPDEGDGGHAAGLLQAQQPIDRLTRGHELREVDVDAQDPHDVPFLVPDEIGGGPQDLIARRLAEIIGRIGLPALLRSRLKSDKLFSQITSSRHWITGFWGTTFR